jgi:hypothetical protein
VPAATSNPRSFPVTYDGLEFEADASLPGTGYSVCKFPEAGISPATSPAVETVRALGQGSTKLPNRSSEFDSELSITNSSKIRWQLGRIRIMKRTLALQLTNGVFEVAGEISFFGSGFYDAILIPNRKS